MNKIFSGTLFRKNITRFWPLWTIMSFFFVIPVIAWSLNALPNVRYSSKLICMDNALYTFLQAELPIWMLFYAIFVGMAVWSFLFKQRSSQFMHSLPLSKNEIFFSTYFSGLAILFIPFILKGIVFALVMLCYDAFSGISFLMVCLVTLLEGIFFFSFATFCAFFSANIVAYPLIYMLLNFAGFLIKFLSLTMLKGFFIGIDSDNGLDNTLSSPFMYLIEKSTVSRDYTEDGDYLIRNVSFEGMPAVAIVFVIGLVLLLVSYLFYKMYKAENAGEVIGIRFLKPVFFVIYLVLVSEATAWIFFSVSNDYSAYYKGYYIFACVFFGITLAYFTALQITGKTLNVFHRKEMIAYIVLTVLALAACVMLRFDVFNIAGRMPEKPEILYVDINYNYGNDVRLESGSDDVAIDKFMKLVDTIAEHRIECMDEDRDSWDGNKSRFNLISYKVKLTNGREITRNFDLHCYYGLRDTEGTIECALNDLLTDQAVIMNILESFNSGRIVANLYGEYDSLTLIDSAKGLLNVYKADVLDGNVRADNSLVDDIKNQDKITFIIECERMDENGNHYTDYNEFYIGPEMKHTLLYLFGTEDYDEAVKSNWTAHVILDY